MNRVDRQLRSAKLRQQFRAALRAERAAVQTTAPIRNAWGEIKTIVADAKMPTGAVQGRIKELLTVALQQTQDRMADHLQTTLETGHDLAVANWAKTVPRRYWVALAAKRLGRREALLQQPGLQEMMKRDFSPIDFLLDLEPLLRGEELPEQKFFDLIKKLIFPPPGKSRVEAILRGDSWPDRKTWPERLRREGFSFDAIVSQIASGMSQGAPLKELTKQVRPLVDGVYYRAARIARTESLRVAQEIDRETWKQADDIIIGVQIHATLDKNTRPHHRERDGRIYWKPGHGDGQYSYSEFPNPPDAANCRCYGSPVLSPL